MISNNLSLNGLNVLKLNHKTQKIDLNFLLQWSHRPLQVRFSLPRAFFVNCPRRKISWARACSPLRFHQTLDPASRHRRHPRRSKSVSKGRIIKQSGEGNATKGGAEGSPDGSPRSFRIAPAGFSWGALGRRTSKGGGNERAGMMLPTGTSGAVFRTFRRHKNLHPRSPKNLPGAWR